MMRLFIVSFVLLLYYSNICNSEYVAGTLVLPCGVDLSGLVYFQKVNCVNMWKGVVNVSFYENLRFYNNNNADLHFQNRVQFYMGDTWVESTRVAFKGGLTHTFFIIYQYLPAVTYLDINGIRVCNTVHNSQLTPLPITSTTSTTMAPTTTPEIVSTTMPAEDDDLENTCGRRKTNMYLNLVSNGNAAESGEWPWHAVVFLKNSRYTNPVCRCGSTILTKKFVITAAHCVIKNDKPYEAKRILVIAGIVDLTDKNCSTCQNSVVKGLYPHPAFDGKNGNKNDIALLKLKTKFEWTDYVRPICIFPRIIRRKLFGEYGTIMGFGATENGPKSDELLYAEVEIHPDDVCHAADRLFFSLFLTDFTFCAGNANSGIGPGPGDSGGGLYLKSTIGGVVRWSLQGIISVGKRSTDQINIEPYVIYTHVNSYFSWISPIVGWHD